MALLDSLFRSPVIDAAFSDAARLQGMLDFEAGLAGKHRGTLIVGRTWLQHAAPTTFGAKVAGWLDVLLRHSSRLREVRERALVLQFGGAVGTLAALGGNGEK